MHHASGSNPVVPAYGLTSRCVQKAAGTPSSTGCCHRHEVKRTNPVDCGADGVGVPSVVVGVTSAGSSLGGPMGPLLKLDANAFLQRAERANLFGCDKRQRVAR